ncbi:dihydrofolate reductase family protein [Acidiferrobacter thiooxydans]|jgi:riboflavin biosynthesis pyrimidine reductase|uniref:RibD family protein n=1 Tax=Acidiferrobacter thiooxydans TaxID=163359 RepID=UPI000825BD57|nr:dihydrofolate reductase family protein [Acidiferrobacter thiooxydans]UEN99478.1 dihydrofolate reductase family protein [Acidiferrobacter thiooxydans]
MPILTLYPGAPQRRELAGLYLDDVPADVGHPFIYANFLASLDGRIALRDGNGHKGVPATIANDLDWRLYTELLVQADAVLTTGPQARAIATGAFKDMMITAHERYPDLRDYRRARGLSAHPVCVVVTSRPHDLAGGALKSAHPGTIVAITPTKARDEVRAARAAGLQVIVVDEALTVTGKDLWRVLDERGLRRVYMTGGPRLFHSLLVDRVVDRLYLTTACRLLGGEEDMETLVRGSVLPLPVEARLRRLALDAVGPPQQLFASYELARIDR